jgi:hypothetical protein
MSNNIQNDIQTVNQTFDDMLAKFKTNYVNFNTNAMLLLPPPSFSNDSSATTRTAPAPAPVTSAAAATPDPNDAELLKYRYAANQLLEKVRSQIASNSKKIAGINTDISPIQKAYLNIMETGTSLDQTKSAAVVSLEDYNELYRTTVFGTMMYAAGAGLILYLLYKPRIQSEF